MARKPRNYEGVTLTPEQVKLVADNVRLAPWWAERLAKRYSWWLHAVDMEDLVSACYHGVCLAALSYDANKGASFASWSVWWMTSAVQAEMSHHGAISLPRGLIDDACCGRLSDRQVTRMWLARRPLSVCPGGEETPVESGECTDSLILDRSMQAEEIVERDEQVQLVRRALRKIPKRQAMAIRLTHLEGMTLRDAGVVMGVSKERVRQLRNFGIVALRKALEAEGVTA